jgi:AcrR family transcriptional regulator
VARTRADDFDDKHRLFLDTAADLFAAKGFSVTTITDIADACGMSKSALYHYHASKEAVLHELLSTHVTQVLRQVQAAVAEHEGPRERFAAFLRALLASNTVSRSKNIVLLNETSCLPSAQATDIRRRERKLVRLGAELLAALNRKAMQRTVLRMPYTMLLFGMVNWTYTWYDPKGPLSPSELAERIGDLFLRGFPRIER